MQPTEIHIRLIELGRKQFGAPTSFHKFTGVREADIMMNNLAKFPHAFVLGCVMDRQVKAEKAWIIPYKVRSKLGSFSMRTLSNLTLRDIQCLMSRPEPLHRFVDIMSSNFHSAIKKISRDYQGDASRIWSEKPSSAEVVCRFLEFDGAGPKISTMAANLLARIFKVPLSDYTSIDVSADVHVRRVFGRLGLCDPDASIEQVIYKARSLNPEFPGILDSPAFEIGRAWCRASDPMCGECIMNDICPSSVNRAKSYLPRARKKR